MKANIHPKYYQTAVTCVCGNAFTVGSTRQSMFVEVCYKCHPLFTGEERFVDVKGQVEKFKTKMERAKTFAPKVKKQDKNRQYTTQKTLKDLLTGATA